MKTHASEETDNRLWAVCNDGSNIVYKYSDDFGQTWMDAATMKDTRYAYFVYDSTNRRLESY